MIFSIAVIFISFLVGFAMKRGGLCTYAAVIQIVHEKRLERLLVFLGAAAWATLVVLPLNWLMPEQFSLSLTHHNIQIALIGGAVLGLGAFLNKGCFFGTFVQLVSGNLNYIATLFGLSVGIILATLYLNPYFPNNINATEMVTPNNTAYFWLAAMVIFALLMVFGIKLNSAGFFKKLMGLCTLSWQSSTAMITIGIGGGLLYATVNGWNYADVLGNTTLSLIQKNTAGPSTTAIISTITMVIGGVTAAITAKEFAIKPAHLVVITACFIGGVLMGLASLLIPGGNDGLLLKGIPSYAPHAFVGYFMMVLIMWLLIYVFRRT